MTIFIRITTMLAVIAGAVVCGWISYTHGYEVVHAHGVTGALAAIYPSTVDGLIYTCSMVLLDHAMRNITRPALATWLLGTGIIAAAILNLWAGISTGYGWPGALIGIWPALVLVGEYEMLMQIIRNSHKAKIAKPITATPSVAPVTKAVLPDDTQFQQKATEAAARLAEIPLPSTSHRQRARHAPGAPTIEAVSREFAAEIGRGEIPSIRDVMKRMQVGKPKAESYVNYIREMGRAAREAA